MSCEQVANELPLYNYGELTQEEEERVEQHLSTCGACTAELGRVRAFSDLMNRQPDMLEPNRLEPGLLERCRSELIRTIRVQGIDRGPRPSWYSRLHSFMNMGVGMRIPAGALALVALGFLAGKVAPGNLPFLGAENGGSQQAGFVTVRSVEPGANGQVHIAYDNVSRRSLSGSVDDKHVRDLLLSSVHDESNAGVRVNAVGVMKAHADEPDVRNALTDALLHDPNTGVRMEALEALRPYSAEPSVRKALTAALLGDANAGIRVKVIDLLTASKDPSLVGPLQTAVQNEENGYVRARASNALVDMNASVGSF